jgi:hypothetical protein
MHHSSSADAVLVGLVHSASGPTVRMALPHSTPLELEASFAAECCTKFAPGEREELFRRVAFAGHAAGKSAVGENFVTQFGGDLRVLL